MSDLNIKYCYPGGSKPTAPDVQVVEIIPSDKFYQIWKDSNVPYFGKEDSDPGLMDRYFVKPYVVEGSLLSIPELYVEMDNGEPRIQFVNGRHRTTNLALMGAPSIPAIVRGDDSTIRAFKMLGLIKPLSAENRRKLDSDEDDPRPDYTEDDRQKRTYKMMLKKWVEEHRPEVVAWFKNSLPNLLRGIDEAATLSDEQKKALAEKMTDFYRDNARVPQHHEVKKMVTELILEQRRQAVIDGAIPQRSGIERSGWQRRRDPGHGMGGPGGGR